MQSHHFEYNFIIFLTLTPPATGLQNSSFLMQISSFLIHNSSLFLTLQSPPLSAVRVSSLLHHEMIVSKTIHFVLKWWTLYQKWRVPWIGVRRFPHPLRYELRGDVSNAFTTDLALKLMNSALNLMSLYFKWWILHLKWWRFPMLLLTTLSIEPYLLIEIKNNKSKTFKKRPKGQGQINIKRSHISGADWHLKRGPKVDRSGHAWSPVYF